MKTTITIPNNLLGKGDTKSKVLTKEMAEVGITTEDYTMSELLSMKDSLSKKVLKASQEACIKHITLKELDEKLLNIDRIEYNLIVVKEALGVGNGASYADIFSKSTLEARKVTFKRLLSLNRAKSATAVREAINKKMAEVETEIGKIRTTLTRYNSTVKVNLPLLKID